MSEELRPRAEIGIIGGSGLYDLRGLSCARDCRIATPFGETSDSIVTGGIGNRSVAFLPRHGRGHRLTPREIPGRANMYALKKIGVRQIISVNAVGSLREDYAPGHFVIPDQIVDWTKGSGTTSFFDDGIVAYASLAYPYCAELRRHVGTVAAGLHETTVHDRGTYCCIEGPQFSSRAESELYRRIGMDIIGMTALPEARLAREAEMCYASLAVVTDYDCWRDGHEVVAADAVTATMKSNLSRVVKALVAVTGSLPDPHRCPCADAMSGAIATDSAAISSSVKRRLSLLLSHHVPGQEPECDC